jgi:hypothetical protein
LTRTVCGSFQDIAPDAHRERAEGAELADMAVEVHDERAGRRVADLAGDLMADALALEQRHVVLGAPFACADVQLFLLRRGRRDHVVDEDGVAVGLGDALDAELLLHLPEVDVGIAGEVIGDHIVGLRHDLVASLDDRQAGDPRQDLFRDRVTHRCSLSNVFRTRARASPDSSVRPDRART